MNKSVLRSAKPYWIYLILTGKKTVEVGKDFPKSVDWNKVVEMYCSKDTRSFNRIPENDREWMRKYLGKVACRFECDGIIKLNYDTDWSFEPPEEGYFFVETETPSKYVLLDFDPCLTNKEITEYGKGKPLYGWHISDLKIYDTPKELGEFRKPDVPFHTVKNSERGIVFFDGWKQGESITRPQQSWCYVEGV